MSAPESPAETVRRGAEKMRKVASDATPGPWHRPLNVRNKAIVTARLPEGETGSYISGNDPATGEREQCCVVLANTWSNGKHYRKRSGRDLEYIAAMDPSVALLIADQWDVEAADMEILHAVARPGGITDWSGQEHAAWTAVHAAALKFLGEEA